MICILTVSASCVRKEGIILDHARVNIRVGSILNVENMGVPFSFWLRMVWKKFFIRIALKVELKLKLIDLCSSFRFLETCRESHVETTDIDPLFGKYMHCVFGIVSLVDVACLVENFTFHLQFRALFECRLSINTIQIYKSDKNWIGMNRSYYQYLYSCFLPLWCLNLCFLIFCEKERKI